MVLCPIISLQICRVYTPLWKSNRIFFSKKNAKYLSFIFCSLLSFSFAINVMWSISIMQILMDFDHCLHFGDIFKRAIESKSDVALVWSIQWARMTSKHEEKYRCRCLVGYRRLIWKCYELPKTCRHSQLASRQFHSPCRGWVWVWVWVCVCVWGGGGGGGLAYRNRDPSCAIWDSGKV